MYIHYRSGTPYIIAGLFLFSLLCAYLVTYLCPSLPVEHRPSTTPRHRNDPPPSHSVLGCSGHSRPVGPLLFQLCFSVSPPTVARSASLSLPCGFQVRAWRVVLDAGFLRVCPVQPHFLRSICLATGSCPARSHMYIELLCQYSHFFFLRSRAAQL